MLNRDQALMLVVGCVALAVAILSVLVLGGCGASQEPARCDQTQLAAIAAAEIAEAVEACRGQTYDTCTAFPAIRAKYDAKREEWVQCH
jgi:hypothetical protein